MKRFCRTILLVAFATLASSLLAVAQNAFKEPWEGRWAFSLDNCSDDAVPIVLDKKEFDLSMFEAACTVIKTSKQGPLHVVNVRCRGEGSIHNAQFKLEVTGNNLTFVEQRGLPFTPKTFVRCDPSASRFANPSMPAPKKLHEEELVGQCMNGECVLIKLSPAISILQLPEELFIGVCIALAAQLPTEEDRGKKTKDTFMSTARRKLLSS